MNDSNSMMGSAEIKFLAIAKANTGQLLLAQGTEKTKKAYAEEVREILLSNFDIQYTKEARDQAQNLQQSSAYPDLREVTESIYGTWFTYCDANLFAYSILTDNEFK